VVADEHLLMKVFSNQVENGIKKTHENGTVSLGALQLKQKLKWLKKILVMEYLKFKSTGLLSAYTR
jgi:hypothetical protein